MNDIGIYGKKQRIETKTKIKSILGDLKKHKKWRNDFYEKFPHLNTAEVQTMITYGYQGNCDDLGLLAALEKFQKSLEEQVKLV